MPFARAGLNLLHKIIGNYFVNSYVKPSYLTHDLERQKSYATDPLIARAISVNVLLDLYSTAERIVADAQTITLPTQLLISGADWVVHKKPQQTFLNASAPVLKNNIYWTGFTTTPSASGSAPSGGQGAGVYSAPVCVAHGASAAAGCGHIRRLL